LCGGQTPTQFVSAAQRLPDGNTFITEGVGPRLIEVLIGIINRITLAFRVWAFFLIYPPKLTN